MSIDYVPDCLLKHVAPGGAPDEAAVECPPGSGPRRSIMAEGFEVLYALGLRLLLFDGLRIVLPHMHKDRLASRLDGLGGAEYSPRTVSGSHGDVGIGGSRHHGRLESVSGNRSQRF